VGEVKWMTINVVGNVSSMSIKEMKNIQGHDWGRYFNSI